MSELPREFNPDRGYIATANHNIMPEDFAPALGYNWSSPVRYHRIDDVLSDSGDFSVEDYMLLQQDVYSSAAEEALGALEGWTGRSDDTEQARRLLTSWNAELDKDSPEAALFKAWHAVVDQRVFDPEMAPEERSSLSETALEIAIENLETSQGDDWSAWSWGAMNHARFEHPVTAAFDLPAVERPGDRTTLNLTAQSGASFREILDVSDWDNSVATNVPGQSGQPTSPHYEDLLPMWASGEYFPLLFTREAIEQNTEYRLVLKPRRDN